MVHGILWRHLVYFAKVARLFGGDLFMKSKKNLKNGFVSNNVSLMRSFVISALAGATLLFAPACSDKETKPEEVPLTTGEIELSKNWLLTSENGQSDTVTIRLAKAPVADVVLPVTTANMAEGTATPISLTFTPDNWQSPQEVTVRGVDDNIADGDVTYYLTLGPATSEDADFSGAYSSVSVTNADDEEAEIVLSKQTIALFNDDSSENFTVSLTSRPLAEIIIGLRMTTEDAGELSTSELTFTSLNWNEPQEVIINGTLGTQAIQTSIELIVTNNMPAYAGKRASVTVNLCADSQHNSGAGTCADGSYCVEGFVFENGTCHDASKLEFISFPAGTIHSMQIDGIPQINIDAFELAKTPTTVGQFQACVVAGACAAENYSSVDWGCNFNRGVNWLTHPMNCINWIGADEFCKWIGGRLPTNDEWKYAATHDGVVALQTPYPWGTDEPTEAHANHNSYVGNTTAVGTYSPMGDSPLGLQDMLGNVWEWTSSCSERSNMTSCVANGGDLNIHPEELYIGYEFNLDAVATMDYARGFRCAK